MLGFFKILSKEETYLSIIIVPIQITIKQTYYLVFLKDVEQYAKHRGALIPGICRLSSKIAEFYFFHKVEYDYSYKDIGFHMYNQ